MRRLGGWLALMATLAVTACAPASSGPPSGATALPTTRSPEPQAEPPRAPGFASTPVPTIDPGSASGSGSPQGGGAQAAVDAAVRDAEAHLGLSPGAVRVEQVEARQWPDRSLGCPRPGVLYAQVVTPGFLIVVSGGGKQLEYHADDRGQVVLCQER